MNIKKKKKLKKNLAATFLMGRFLLYDSVLWHNDTLYVSNQHLRSVVTFGITSVSLHSDLLITVAAVLF